MGKGSVTGGSNLYMGTAALSSGDYVHRAIDHADLIISIGHDTVEKPPFIMGPDGPKVIHVGFTAASVEQVYFPHAEVVGDVGPSLALLADRIEGKLRIDPVFTSLRSEIMGRIRDRADEGLRRQRAGRCAAATRAQGRIRPGRDAVLALMLDAALHAGDARWCWRDRLQA